MSTNKLKSPKATTNDAAAIGYLRSGDLYHKAEIQMLIALAEANGIKVSVNEKDGEVTIEKAELQKDATQPQSFAQMQRTPLQPSAQPTIDYVKLANALTEPVSKGLQNAVESSPVHIQVAFDSSAHMVNNQTAMTLAREEWAKWVKIIGNETLLRLAKVHVKDGTSPDKVITFGDNTVRKVPEDELYGESQQKSGMTGCKAKERFPRLLLLWNHVWSDIVTSWWRSFAYVIALCCLVLAVASWYRQWQLEAVVKEYYIIKPVLKQDRHYAPFIHTLDSVILRDGIDEVCERVYGEKR